MIKIAKKYQVTGRVQGVGFRYFTQKAASRIGVYGYAKNLYDGSVEVYAIGTEEQLNNLKKMLYTGPSYSSVSNVFEQDAPLSDKFHSFKISY